MVVLIGPAGKSTILLVEFAKVRGDAGLPTAEAAVEAARLRLAAVMMTALSFLLGALPLVFASGFVVVGGMAAATVVGAVLIPVPYYVVERVARRRVRPPARPRPR